MARYASGSVPYAGATSGATARDDITKLLRRFGCESIGFMDDFETNEVMLAFAHRGRRMQLRASAKGWAALYLKENPWTSRRFGNRAEYERKALTQGQIAVNSILRDWVKGQVMAVETGILSFEAVFMPYMLTENGETVIDRIASLNLLPPPAAQ
jgi:hypothetical protein